jgi:signal transduction histidine kinase
MENHLLYGSVLNKFFRQLQAAFYYCTGYSIRSRAISSSTLQELAHELSNPLTVASFSLEELQQLLTHSVADPTALKQRVSVALEAIIHARSLLHAISYANEQSQPQILPFEVEPVLCKLVQLLQLQARPRGVFIFYMPEKPRHINPEHRLYVRGSELRFQQVVINLVTNAIEAYLRNEKDTNRTVLITLQRNGAHCVVAVQDWGSGISAELAATIFQPGFSTKSGAGQRGIGLALTRRIVEEEFGGQITVESATGEGTQFLVTLPLCPPE